MSSPSCTWMAPSAAIASTPPESNTACARLTDVRTSSFSGLNGIGTPVHHMNRFRPPDLMSACFGPYMYRRGWAGMDAETQGGAHPLRGLDGHDRDDQERVHPAEVVEDVEARLAEKSLRVDHRDPEPWPYDGLREH